MATTINISLTPEHMEKLNFLTKDSYRKQSDLLRKWIDEHYEEAMKKDEQALREKAIKDYLEERTIEILEKIAKLFLVVMYLKQMTLQEFLRIKSEKIKKAILDAFFREYNQYEVFNA